MSPEQDKMIEDLYLELYSKLMAYSRSSLQDTDLAEEAVQETFRIACQKITVLSSHPNPHGWILATLKNVISNTRKTRNRSNQFLAGYIHSRNLEDVAIRDTLPLNVEYGELAQTEEFQLIAEMAIEGKSHKELAAKRGITVDACKKRAQRARNYLRKILK